MTWTSAQILENLSSHATKFEFPLLDNAHWRFITGRLRGFRRERDWALTFELLIFHSAAGTYGVQVYGFGSLIPGNDPDRGARDIISECADDPLWNSDSEWQGWTGVTKDVMVNGSLLTIASTPSVPHDVVLSDGDMMDELTFGSALVRELGCRRLLPESCLQDVGIDVSAEFEVFRLSDWDHPDLAGAASVRSSVALRAAARVLSGEETEFRYDHEGDNTHWRNWNSGMGPT